MPNFNPLSIVAARIAQDIAPAPPPVRAVPPPGLVVAQIASLGPLLDALIASAAAANMPQAVTMGLTWLRDGAASVLADARNAAEG